MVLVHESIVYACAAIVHMQLLYRYMHIQNLYAYAAIVNVNPHAS